VPIAFQNAQSKAFEGLAPELLRLVAKDAGLQIEFQSMIFGEQLAALADKRIDITASGLGPTPEREKVADFTDSYGSFRDAMVVPIGDARDYSTTADFKGLAIACLKGTAYCNGLTRAGAIVTVSEASPDLLTAVESGRVNGAVNDALVLTARLKDDQHPKLKMVTSYPAFFVARLAFGVQKGNAELLAKLNASLAKLQADGTVKKLTEKWGIPSL
jgi:polar amino acid transport system substrate-binding protein